MANISSDSGTDPIEGSDSGTVGKKNEQQPETPIQPQPQQQADQPKSCTQQSTPEKRKRTSLIAIISVIIVAAVVGILLIAVLLSGTNPFAGADDRFVGDWEQNTLGSPTLWRFTSDSTLEIGPSDGPLNNRGTWKGDATLLCLYNTTVCYTYEFSNNGNVMTLNIIDGHDNYAEYIVLTKKGQEGTDQTPTIECVADASTNRITITYIDENVKWKDIEITTNPPATWQVQDGQNIALAKLGITATITTYASVDDTILVLDVNGDVIVTLKYLPTNTVLGNWTVNV